MKNVRVLGGYRPHGKLVVKTYNFWLAYVLFVKGKAELMYMTKQLVFDKKHRHVIRKDFREAYPNLNDYEVAVYSLPTHNRSDAELLTQDIINKINNYHVDGPTIWFPSTNTTIDKTLIQLKAEPNTCNTLGE